MLELAVDLYFNQKLSLAIVAERLKTYPNKVRRLLMDAGYTLRDKETAQLIALENGRANHPTKGKTHTDEAKQKISASQVEAWKKNPERHRQLVERSKKNFREMTLDQKIKFNLAARKGRAFKVYKRPKIEKYLLDKLEEYEFEFESRKFDLVPFEEIWVDIFLPRGNIVVEVDGPIRFKPICGDKFLRNRLEEDNKKNGLLLYYGYHVIRLRIARKTINHEYKEQVWAALFWEIERLTTQEFDKPQFVPILIE